jgi:hypothetical protein
MSPTADVQRSGVFAYRTDPIHTTYNDNNYTVPSIFKGNNLPVM